MKYRIRLNKYSSDSISINIRIRTILNTSDKNLLINYPINIIVNNCESKNIDWINNTNHDITNNIIIKMLDNESYKNNKDLFNIIIKDDIADLLLNNGIWFYNIIVSHV